VKIDHKKSLEWYLKSAEKGHSMANYNIGYSYQTGTLGLEKDITKALTHYSVSEKHGNIAAFKQIGLLFLEGTDVKKDVDKGIAYLKKSVAGKHSLSDVLFKLAEIYLNGEYGVKADRKLGFSYLKRAADKRYPLAIKKLEDLKDEFLKNEF
jgi:uncharacterized protein